MGLVFWACCRYILYLGTVINCHLFNQKNQTIVVKEIIVKQGQSLADIAIQYYGNIAGLFDLADRNDISMTAPVSPGTKLLVGEPIRKNLVLFLEKERVTIASNKDIPSDVPPVLSGIGFWSIGDTFIVS